MRFVLPLVALCAFSSAALRADMFNITLSGTFSGSGTFTTDGSCSTCFPGGGLLSLDINIGPDSGTDAFDIIDDSLIVSFYSRPANFLGYVAFNSETGDRLLMDGASWDLSSGAVSIGTGTYSVTPVPEPSSLFLLMPIVALIGLRWRHQRHRV